MKAVTYHEFNGPIAIETVPDPSPAPDGAVIQVEATGLCRSDWHGWCGHDPDIKCFPHVPGHEFAGTVVAVGRDVRRAKIGDRVTMPFVAGCGNCRECQSGNEQVCDAQFQPGFTAWGSFAEHVAVRYADTNLVTLPPEMTSIAAAALGCRVATAYRAVAVQGRVNEGDWVAVHGCGGLGLSAIMIASALGAKAIAIDIRPEPLALARELGAAHMINALDTPDVPASIHDLTHGGADISLDTLGSATTFANSILSLRKRGRHVQVGLLTAEANLPTAPLNRLLAWELELAGSHGLQAHAYPALFDLINTGQLNPTKLIDRTLPLAAAPPELASLNDYRGRGVTIFSIVSPP